jgi:hypothetical protein
VHVPKNPPSGYAVEDCTSFQPPQGAEDLGAWHLDSKGLHSFLNKPTNFMFSWTVRSTGWMQEVAQSINEILKLQWQLLVPHVGFALSHQIKMFP